MSGSLLLWGLQSPINIGMLLRVAEVYQKKVYIIDTFSVFGRPAAQQTISDFAVGALGRNPPVFLPGQSIASIAAIVAGRLIVSTSGSDAESATKFKWKSSDCIILGNEYDGLDAGIERKLVPSI